MLPEESESWRHQAPRTKQGLLNRERLVDRIGAIGAAHCRVVLIHAPAGYGKTILLSDRYRHHAAQGHIVAWLTCSMEDREPENFRESCRRSLLAALPPESRRRLSTGGLTDLENINAPLCLVIDDFQLASSLENWNLVAYLGSVLPDNVTLLIGSRTKPPAEVTRFIIDGTLAVIDSQLLRFNREEIAQVSGAALPPAALESLIRLSEGWPAVVQLAALNAHIYFDRSDVLAGFRLGSADLFDYLTSEIFGALAPDARVFLEDCSILPYLDVHATRLSAEAVERILECLKGLHPLISIVDEEPQRLHFHPLLSDYLAKRIRIRDPANVAQLYRKAAVYFQERGTTYEAIQCAVRGGDWSLASNYFEQTGGVLAIVDRGPPKVKALLELFPQSLVMETPTMLMASIVVAVANNDCLEARQYYLRLIELYNVTGTDSLLTAPLLFRLTLFYYAIVGDLFADLTDVIHALVEPTLVEVRTGYNHDKRFLCLALSGQFMLLQRYGNTGVAERALMEFIEICQMRGFAGRLPSMMPHLGLLAYGRGNYDLAVSYVERRDGGSAFEFSRREVSMEAIVKALRGRIHFDRNEPDGTLACLETLDAIGDVAFPEIMIGTVVTRARAYMALGDLPRALAVLEAAHRKAIQYDLTEWSKVIRAVMTEFYCRAGRLEDAQSTAVDCALPQRWSHHGAAVDRSWPFMEAEMRALIPVLVAQGDLARARNVLIEFQLRAAQAGRELISAVALIFLAVIEQNAGHPDRCRRYLEQSLVRTGAAGVVQPYIELGGEVMGVLATLTERSSGSMSRHARAIVTAFEATLKRAFFARQDFTCREAEAAIGLASGYSNKQLAKMLGVTPDTLKGYVKNVFKKFGARTRAEVARKARRFAALL